MRRRIALACVALLLASGMATGNAAGQGGGPDPAVDKLRVEYESDPLGIEVERPRLSWVLESRRRSVAQQAYECFCSF
jgi:hypothetical protein